MDLRRGPLSSALDSQGWFARFIQLMFQGHWKQTSDSQFSTIYINQDALLELRWWTDCTNLEVGHPFLQPDRTMSIVTDTSKEGLGGHLGA